MITFNQRRWLFVLLCLFAVASGLLEIFLVVWIVVHGVDLSSTLLALVNGESSRASSGSSRS